MSQNPESSSPDAAADAASDPAQSAAAGDSATVEILQNKLVEAEAKAQENWDKRNSRTCAVVPSEKWPTTPSLRLKR